MKYQKKSTNYENEEEKHDIKVQSRRATHEAQRDKDLADMKEYYATHKDYFKRKNQEHYARNKEKWAERRKQTSYDWVMRNCSRTTANGILNEFGLAIEIEDEERISIFKIFSLLEAFGYDLDSHHDYAPYEKRYKACIEEYRTLQELQGLEL